MRTALLNRVVFCMSIAGLMTVSCKHYLPANNNGTTENPPVTTNSCSPDSIYFQQQVLPIIASNCAMSGCHDPVTHAEGLVLNSYSNIVQGENIRPFQPNESKIWKVIATTNLGDRMPPPPKDALTTEQKNIIYKWIMQGAFFNSCQSLNCDTSNVTYSMSIRPIIVNKCQGCHSASTPSGGIDLSQYTGVKAKVTDGKLWGSINFMQGYSAMPKNGQKLSDCELRQFRIWMDAGALNN
jgi:hypothetical protein